MIIADLHIHSHYSRATSSQMNVEEISRVAKVKGIDVIGTGDFTHPLWLEELEQHLKPVKYGIYEYNGTSFILSSEISCIYSQGNKIRRIHIVFLAPSFEIVKQINKKLNRIGNLKADGRPILGISALELVKIIKDVSEEVFVIPAHIWTPWFSLFGANSGFDSIEECFGPYMEYIGALETGLSSDPAMNWMLSGLDKFSLVSNSDAHSPANLGREANVLNCEIDYFDIIDAIKNKDKKKFLYTIEFFPQEGKYHYDGHRNCNLCLSPQEAIKLNNICPKCNKPLTIGVMHRVVELSDREYGFIPDNAIPFKHLIPLKEIIQNVYKKKGGSKEVERTYQYFIKEFGSEFNTLLNIDVSELNRVDPKVADGIALMIKENVDISPGYDGEYGKISIPTASISSSQMELF